MSLYNMLFGVNRFAPLLVKMVGLDLKEIPRFRDAYIQVEEDKGTKRIVVHTRTGGGNREAYHELNETLKTEVFLFDRDDDFDPTYANWFYSIPEKWKDIVDYIAKINPRVPPDQRWQDLLEKLKAGDKEDPEVAQALEVGREIFTAMGLIDEGKA